MRKEVALGRQEDTGTSNPKPAWDVNYRAGHDPSRPLVQVVAQPPHNVTKPIRASSEEVCVRSIGAFSRSTSRRGEGGGGQSLLSASQPLAPQPLVPQPQLQSTQGALVQTHLSLPSQPQLSWVAGPHSTSKPALSMQTTAAAAAPMHALPLPSAAAAPTLSLSSMQPLPVASIATKRPLAQSSLSGGPPKAAKKQYRSSRKNLWWCTCKVPKAEKRGEGCPRHKPECARQQWADWKVKGDPIPGESRVTMTASVPSHAGMVYRFVGPSEWDWVCE